MLRSLCLVVVCLTLAVNARVVAAAEGPRDAAEERLARARNAVARLERPLIWSERNPWLRFLAYPFADEVEPHLRAIEELARHAEPSSAHALVSVLDDPGFPYRLEAGAALMHVANPVAIAPLVGLLDGDDPLLSRMAARVLGAIAGVLAAQPQAETDAAEWQRESEAGVHDAHDALVRVLEEHADPLLRVAALLGLVSIGTEEALFSAYDIGVEDPHSLVRCGLLSSTAAFVSQPRGARITPAHLRMLLRKSIDFGAIDAPLGVWARGYYGSVYYSKVSLESDCIDVNETAMTWLASLNDPAVLPALLRAAASSDPALRATAAWGLARFNDDRAFEQAVAALSSPYWGIRKAAIEGLGRSKHPDADARLASILSDGSRLDRREAAKALAGSFGASLALIETFNDRAVEVRDEAEAALLRSDIVVQKLQQALADANTDAPSRHTADVLERRRRRIQDGLEKWQRERGEAESALVQGLAAEDPRVRIRSARVLSHYESRNSLDLLLAALDSGTSPESESAALALGLRGDARAREPLERAALGEHEDLAVAAIRALQDLRRPESLPLLRRLESRQTSERVVLAVRYAIALLERLGG